MVKIPGGTFRMGSNDFSSEEPPVSVTVGSVAFDRVSYDRDADVLYLGVGDPAQAVEFDESAEGHALRHDADGRLVGITMVNCFRVLLTRPAHRR
jgi:uncharacterized protein YuzE